MGTEIFELPIRMFAKIIGIGGERIKGMRQQTGANIRVDKEGACKVKVTISGTREQVRCAQREIDTCVRDEGKAEAAESKGAPRQHLDSGAPGHGHSVAGRPHSRITPAPSRPSAWTLPARPSSSQ